MSTHKKQYNVKLVHWENELESQVVP